MRSLLHTLSRYAHFSQEKILELKPLAQQGHCNQNYLLITERKHYVLRLFGKEERDRTLEYGIQTQAYEKEIAPQPLILDIQNRFMVSEYIAGTHKKYLKKAELKILADTLRTLHSIKIDAAPITLESDTIDLEIFHFDPVLCHNDLNPHNLIWHTSLTLIDWEYAGTNDRYFDLASVLVEFVLDASDRILFLAAYFQSNSWDKAKLTAYMKVYRHVCEQWWEYQNSARTTGITNSRS